MKVGQNNVPDERRWQKRIRPRDFSVGQPNVMRIVNGPVHRWLHLWPTQVEDQATNVMKNTWHSAYVERDRSTAIDKLAQIDIVFKTKHLKARGADTKQVKSMLGKIDRYDYAVISRKAGEAPSVEVFEANWSIYSAIKENAKKIDPTNPRMLMYGLCYMYDICVSKIINDKTRQFNYKVDVMPNCPTAGKIPDQYLDTEKCPVENPLQYFSAQDVELIKATDWELKDIDLPVQDDELVKLLRAYPIDLGRRDKRNPSVFIFFNDKEDFQALQSFATTAGLPILIPTPTDMGALPAPGTGAAAALPAADNEVDADFETIPETAPAAPAQPAPAAPAYPPAMNTMPMAEKVAPTRTDAAPVAATQPQPAPAATPAPAPAPAPGAQSTVLKQPDIW